MRKNAVLFTVVGILLMVGLALAQTPREGTSSEGKTTFTNIAVVGLNNISTNTVDGIKQVGTPGYIEMVSSSGKTFYLYIGTDERLRIASATVIGLGASPATVGWSNASGKVVGDGSGF